MGGITHAYDSGSVAVGGAIDSGAQDFGSSDEISVFLDNSAGAVARQLVIDFLRDDGTVEFTHQPAATAAAARAGFSIGTGATAKGTAGTSGSIEAVPAVASRKMRFTVAAAGVAAARLTARGRY